MSDQGGDTRIDLLRRFDAALKRIEALEAALQWIVKSCDVRIHRLSLFDEIQDRARAALAPEQDK